MKVVSGSCLRSGETRSCGCLKTEVSKDSMRRTATKHKREPEPIYPVVINKDKFDDWWMFGEGTDILRLQTMFY